MGNLEAAQLLLTAGADVNARMEHGLTALHCAALQGLEEMVQLLLHHVADDTLTDDRGRTAVQIASSHKQSTIVRLLTRQGKSRFHSAVPKMKGIH
jgi:ankyrin repeat protein